MADERGGRMPNPYTLADGTSSWDARYKGFSQLSAQVTRYFRRWSIYIGGENLTNFKQKNPIIDAADPWGDRFDSTMIWGRFMERKVYRSQVQSGERLRIKVTDHRIYQY